MKRIYKYILGFLLIISTTASVAYACSCSGYANDEEHIEGTDVIFLGKAIHTIDLPKNEDENAFRWRHQSTQFNVIEIWKGRIEAKKTIIHSDGTICCMCGLTFEPHEYYLVFAHMDNTGGLSSSSCSGTIAISLSKYRSFSYEEPTGYYEIFKALAIIPSTKY